MVTAKFKRHIARRFPESRQQSILEMFADSERLNAMSVNSFIDRFVI